MSASIGVGLGSLNGAASSVSAAHVLGGHVNNSSAIVQSGSSGAGAGGIGGDVQQQLPQTINMPGGIVTPGTPKAKVNDNNLFRILIGRGEAQIVSSSKQKRMRAPLLQ